MHSLTQTIVNLPHECSAKELNKKLKKICVSHEKGKCQKWHYRIGPIMPRACKDLANHKWTIVELPVYKGDYQFKPLEELTPAWFESKK